MENLNIVILEGNLTADPELKRTRTDKSVCIFTLAVNHRPYGDEKPVSFVQIEAWGKLADNCATYLRKGSSVTVQGEIRQERWEKDGQKQSRLKIVAANVRFNPSKKKDGTENESPPPFRGYGSVEEDPDFPF